MKRAMTLTFALNGAASCSASTRALLPSPALSPSRPFFSGVLRRRRTRWASSRMVIESPPQEEEIDPGAVEGTDLRIIRYPHPLLRAENATVQPEEFNDELKRIAKEMLLIMYASRGVGLAAPQVGINKRLMVFNPEASSKAFLQEIVMVNPEIIAKSKKTVVDTEACLSFPDMSGNVRRHEWVKVQAQRLNGKPFKTKYEGWTARIFQHEFDHLQGIMYIDRLEEEDKQSVKETLGRLIQEYKQNPYENQPPSL